MDFAIYTVIAFVLALLIAILLVVFWARARKKKDKKFQVVLRILAALLIWLVLVVAIAAVYLLQYNHADEEAVDALQSSKTVTVTEEDHYIFFDGEGTSNAMVFLPGGKVDAAAYAPLMQRLAEGGVDCYLVEPAFHMPFFGADIPETIMSSNRYDHWYLSGHSLGGVVALTALDNTDNVDGVFLLASYPTTELPEGLPFYSIYGSNDTVMDREAYEDGKQFWPHNAKEVVLKGGNHSYYGDYGLQEGDSPASLTPKEQQQKTADIILTAVE